jgi:hypothetical protein
MNAITTYKNGQSDLEFAASDYCVLLQPFIGTAPITTLEAVAGGLDATKFTNLLSVGNLTKKDGVKLSNNPTINEIKSGGYGSPTRLLASEAEKSITFVPQELKKINIQNYWGIVSSAFTAPSTTGGVTVAIPELPANLQWRAVLLMWDTYNGQDVVEYYIANKATIGKRVDLQAIDSNVVERGHQLVFQTDPAVGSPLIWGMCGAGWQTANSVNTTGFYPAVTGITVTPTTAAITAAAGVNHTKQLAVADSNAFDRTAAATYVSSDPTKATVSAAGLITGVAVGTCNVTATWDSFNAVCAVTVS